MDKNHTIYRLCLKNVPRTMKILDLKKLCLQYGNVIVVTDSQKTGYKFVDFATLRDMQEALKGLNQNPYGIIADVANISKNVITEKANNHIQNNTNFVGTNSNFMSKNDSNAMSFGGKIRKCVLCNKNANKKCQRCGDFYCSVQCQTKDWQKHRYICIPIPNLIDITENNSDVNDDDYDDNEISLYAGNKNDETNNKKYIRNNDNDCNNVPEDIFVNKEESKNENNKENSDTEQSYNMQNNFSSNNADNTAKIVNSSTTNSIKLSPTSMSNSNDNRQNSTRQLTSDPVGKKQTVGKITISKLPSSGSHVVLTGVIKSNLFFIRSIDTNTEYIKILQTINDAANNSKLIEKLPKKGELLLAEYDGLYYRAVVQSVENENNILVMFFDFGNIENVDMKKLKYLSAELFNYECYALPICIKDVPDVPLTQEIYDYLDNYLDCIEKKLEIIYQQNNENEKILVELKDVETNEIINKKIIELLNNKDNKTKDAKENISFLTMKDIEQKLIPDAENIELVVFDNSFADSGYISCIQQEYINPLFQFCEKLSIYAKSINEPYRPRVSELCVALYVDDDNWYRAECTNIVDKDNYEVLFVDFGNKTVVHINNIRKYPNGNDFMYPCHTNICMIADIPDKLNSATVARIQDLIPPNENMSITKITRLVTKFGEKNLIYIPDVITKLKFERLI